MDLFEDIVNESILLTELNQSREKDIIKAINNVLRVRINYNDKDKNDVWNYEKTTLVGPDKGKNERFILPVAFGLTKSGKKAVRAYQTTGSTRRGKPHWKLFLLDNIFQWANGKKSFKEYKNSLIDLGLNTTGDKGMTTLFAISPIANDNVKVSSNTNPIDSTPLTKNDITPTQNSQSPNFNGDNNFVPSSNANKSIDNTKVNNYNINSLTAPNTEPITKQDVNPSNTKYSFRDRSGKFVKQPYNFASDKRQFNINSPEWQKEYDKAAMAAKTEPITKSDIEDEEYEENPLTKSFNDINNRMDNLYKNK